MTFVGQWMELENIMLSEVAWAQKANTACCLSHADSSFKLLDWYAYLGVPIVRKLRKGLLGEEGKRDFKLGGI